MPPKLLAPNEVSKCA